MLAANIRKCAKIATASIAVLSSASHAQEFDEVKQLQRFKDLNADHLNPEKTADTRFVVDRNDRGAFSQTNNIGIVYYQSDTDSSKIIMGTATVLNGCYAITSYHVVEGRSIIDSNKIPIESRKVKFSFGGVYGSSEGFNENSMDAIVVDPEILDLTNRKWAKDVVLIRFRKKLANQSYSPIKLATLVGKSLNSSERLLFEKQFFVSFGYPGDKIQSIRKSKLYADFCNPKAAILDYGVITDCKVTGGMSGGPFFMYEKRQSSSAYDKILVGLNIQAGSIGTDPNNLKDTAGVIAGLTDSMIRKIKKFTDQDLDDTCH